MEKIEEFFSFEAKLDTKKVRSKAFILWYFFRIYIASQLTFGYDRSVKPDGAHLKKLLKHFFRGFFCWFGTYDMIVLSSSDQRRLIDGKFSDRMDFYEADKSKKLFLELPAPDHYSKSKTASAHLISRLHLYALEWLMIKLHPLINLEGYDELQKAKSFGADINEQYLAKRFHVQHKVFSHLLKRWKPKVLVVVNSYTNMAYVKAAKDFGIKVVELQHGVINAKHYAYQVRFETERSYYPDYLLSFGQQEKEVFTSNNHFINPDKVLPVGSFYLDYLSNQNRVYPELESKGKYRLRVCISGQVAFEDKMLEFIKEVSALCEDVLFAYVPRHINDKLLQFDWPVNACLITSINVYECIKACDVHSTVNSTCAIEALSLGTSNILMDVEGRASLYFSEMLGTQGYTHFAADPLSFAKILRDFKRPDRSLVKASNEKLIVNNFSERLHHAFTQILRNDEQ